MGGSKVYFGGVKKEKNKNLWREGEGDSNTTAATLPWCKIEQSVGYWAQLFPMHWYIESSPPLCGTSSEKFRHTVNNPVSHSLISVLFHETH